MSVCVLVKLLMLLFLLLPSLKYSFYSTLSVRYLLLLLASTNTANAPGNDRFGRGRKRGTRRKQGISALAGRCHQCPGRPSDAIVVWNADVDNIQLWKYRPLFDKQTRGDNPENEKTGAF